MNISVLQRLLNPAQVKVFSVVENNKASETYVKTRFIQDNGFSWNTYVPYIDRRAGLDIKTEADLAAYLKSIRQYFTREAMQNWRTQEKQRGKIGGDVTPLFFDVLLSFKEECDNFPANPNPARRIQDIKDAGYTLASVPKGNGLKGYNRILLPLPIHTEMGYETFTPQFKARVIRLLGGINAYEAKPTTPKALIPDHKFSEVRWDEATKAENPMTMGDEEVREKFQLLDNQRNQQKREICRRCFQENIRGTIYGIKYYYKGNEFWDAKIPKVGKQAEKGCIGCPWYDIQKWRDSLNNRINNK